ncbi:chromosome segregation protein SMC [Candidatus Woesearchaeota archaeon CG10_big_fil_rev_8_21_14_0_10_37_12]|nr:MAG: chromosome segregation protein SMC [Candidatus Woesearchaeota archaeon CG10_big_fil_rev_8_21_14_0_10_37_12]
MNKEEELQLETPTSVKPTKIKRLILNGFKSFGKYSELQFGDEFNVILGPNGSGKSNILDALCFVLGKSSSKQLRAEKSANLIYNGGKTKQPAKTAEVSIVLDNINKAFPLDEEEIKLSRIVRYDGSSKYQINGKTKTRQEIIELLGSAKINPDGYNIILQGDIVRLVEMSPLERRQIIEEIAGIGAYEEKKQQALNELQKVEEKLNEAEIVLKEREGYLKDLKKDRDNALQYKETADKIKQNKASWIKKQTINKEQDLKQSQQKSSTNKEKLSQLEQKIKTIREEINKNKQTINDINKEIEQKGEIDQINLQKELEQLRIDLATHKTRISNCNTELARIQQRKEQLDKNLVDVNEKLTEQEEQKKQLKAQLDAVKQTLTELDNSIKTFKQKHKLEDESNIDKQFEELDKTADEKQKEIHELREKQQILLREKDKAEFQLQTADEKIAKVKELETIHKEDIAKLKKNKEEFKKTVLELNRLLNQDSEEAKTLATIRRELQQLREEEHKLSIAQTAVQENISANIAVKKILENKKQFGTVYGTIAELGSSENKYAVALEVAAANRIHSIIVDDDKTAANAIKYLKKEQLGSASFLPLNKIKPADTGNITKFVKHPGCYGLALDLIDYDIQLKNAFSNVFGNTLVVDNIETARKIGIGEARMVTLDGDLCERSGAMTGGFRHKKKGTFQEKGLLRKIEQTRTTITKIENKIEQTEQSRKENEEQIVQLRGIKANLEGEIIKQEKSLHIETGDLEATKNYKEELLETSNKISKQLKELEKNTGEKTKELTQLKIDKQQLRTKITELRNPRVLAELNAFEEQRKQLAQEEIKLEAEQKNILIQIKDILGRDKENMNKLLKDLKKEQEAFTDELKTLNNTIKDKEKQLKQKEQEQEKFQSQFKGLFEKRNKLNEIVNQQETKSLEQEEKSRKEELTLNTISIEEARINAELAALNAEFEQYADIELNMKKNEEQLKNEIKEYEKILARIGNVNLRALDMYETAEKEHIKLVEKKNTLFVEKTDVLNMMQEIETNKKDLFVKTLTVVNDQFKNIFTQLTTKGQAYLELENPENPLSAGLQINVKITGNKFLDIRSLSGGEKTLTALAFLFAIQEHEPATFYILDEVDAALDKHNSQKLAKLIRDYCRKAQYIVISHNDSIISEGDQLYGISMNTETGLSNVVSIKL